MSFSTVPQIFESPKTEKEPPGRYRICTLNFSPRTQTMLKMVLDRYGDGHFVFSSLADSEILLINGDAPNVINEVHEARTAYYRPAIVLSTTQYSDIPDAVCLLNPISPKLLIETLNQQLEKIRPRESQASPLLPENTAQKLAEQRVQNSTVAAETPAQERNKTEEVPLRLSPPLPPELHAKSPKFSFTATEIETARAEWRQTKEALKSQKLGRAANMLEHGRNSPDNRGGFLRDVDLKDPKQLRGVYFHPEGTLAELLRKILLSANDHSPLLEISINGKQLVLDFTLNRWGGDYDEQQLRAVSLGALPPTLGVRWIPREESTSSKFQRQSELEMVVGQATPSKMQPIPDRRKQRAEFILAQIGLWCSHGRLPEGTDINAPLRLRYWPNMPHLPRTPGAMRLAALWVQKPCSLVETVQMTGMMQKEVFAFYVICHTLNLFSWQSSRGTPDIRSPSEKKSPLKFPAKKESATAKSFFRRLMARVWSNSEESLK